MYGWRGTIGLVKPTFRPGPLEAFIRLMPDGVCVVPRYVGIRSGTEKEFEEALAIVDQRVGELAALKVDGVAARRATLYAAWPGIRQGQYPAAGKKTWPR